MRIDASKQRFMRFGFHCENRVKADNPVGSMLNEALNVGCVNNIQDVGNLNYVYINVAQCHDCLRVEIHFKTNHIHSIAM